MTIALPPQKRRDALMRMPIGELAGWHLLARCDTCRAERIVSVLSLMERYGLEVTLLRIVPRLRCGARTCRQPPTQLRLRNRLPVHPGPPLVDVTLIAPPSR
jgi:hypothetical protein